MTDRMMGPTPEIAGLLKMVDGIIQAEAKNLGKTHYGCRWQKRDDGVYHICSKENREWKV